MDNIFSCMENVEKSINELQKKEEREGGLDDHDTSILWDQLSMHHSFLSQQKTFWRQNFRVLWIRAGDRNTRFFYQATIIKRHRNRIRALRHAEGG